MTPPLSKTLLYLQGELHREDPALAQAKQLPVCWWSKDSLRARSRPAGMRVSDPAMETLRLLEQGWGVCSWLLHIWGGAGAGTRLLKFPLCLHTEAVGTSLPSEYQPQPTDFPFCFPPFCCQGSNLDHHFWKAALFTYIQPIPHYTSHLLGMVFHHGGKSPNSRILFFFFFFCQAICILFSWHYNCQKGDNHRNSQNK